MSIVQVGHHGGSNTFGDRLPIIPAASRVENGNVLYRIQVEVSVTMNGNSAAGVAVSLTSDRSADTISPGTVTTDAAGRAMFTIETRLRGNASLTARAQGESSDPLQISFIEAWYESGFEVTAYNVCAEVDFNGEMIQARGLNERHRRDFLLGGRGVAMQGTGLGSNGRYITITNPRALRWRPRYAGIENEADAQFAYVDAPRGRYNAVVQGTSIAVDPSVIPPRHRVHIQSSDGGRVIGERRADDTGGGIRAHHIDVFMGEGNDAMTRWRNAGGNLNGARVRYLGP